MDRIFQDIKIKASNSEQRIITAIANSGVLDRTGEIVSIAGITYDPKTFQHYFGSTSTISHLVGF